jgi:cation diffusion facilitator CzcD-associated flavoprotein CzcO
MEPEVETLDIIIVGAGLTGVNSAYRVQTELPHRSYAILESRSEIGGTWSFWNYPGVRTDSSMALFGFPWRPWPHDANMAEGPAIRKYMEECAAAEGIDKKIRFGHRIVASNWSSAEQRWTLQVEVTHPGGTIEKRVFKAWWVINGSGYYSYEKPLPAVIPGIERFGGKIVHPQFWDESVDYAGKRLVIIGSGATAVTLFPALANAAKSITLLQRTPSYILSMPFKDHAVAFLSKLLPLRWARMVNWWLRMAIETLFVKFLLTFPRAGRRLIVSEMRKQLPEGFDVDKHFNPWYNPFEQRLCFCPGGDFFQTLHQPNARIVTDTIDTVTETGILLKSGETLEADIIITATGLYFALLSGVAATVDGVSINDTIANRYIWNGVMLEGVPNTGLITGYTAATWTPGADVRVRQLIKVIKHMEKAGATTATPYIDPAERARLPMKPAVGLNSTYVLSAYDRTPKQAGIAPWINGSNWAGDMWRLMTGNVKEGMKFTFAGKKKDI